MAKDTINVAWEVDDGYVCGARPHSTSLQLSDFDDFETEEEVRRALIDDLEEDFRQQVTLVVSDEQSDAVVSAWKTRRTKPEA